MEICRETVKYGLMQRWHESVDITVNVFKICKTVNTLKMCNIDTFFSQEIKNKIALQIMFSISCPITNIYFLNYI
jgi:hypothetical protein